MSFCFVRSRLEPVANASRRDLVFAIILVRMCRCRFAGDMPSRDDYDASTDAQTLWSLRYSGAIAGNANPSIPGVK